MPLHTPPPAGQDFETRVDAYALRLTALLEDGLTQLNSDIVERLRFARTQAVGSKFAAPVHARPVVAQARSLATVGGGYSGGWGDGSWKVRAALGGFALLMASAFLGLAVDVANQSEQELHEMDVSILLDSLPPEAYTDSGFTQYLLQSQK